MWYNIMRIGTLQTWDTNYGSISLRRSFSSSGVCVYGSQTGRLVLRNIYVGIIEKEVLNLERKKSFTSRGEKPRAYLRYQMYFLETRAGLVRGLNLFYGMVLYIGYTTSSFLRFDSFQKKPKKTWFLAPPIKKEGAYFVHVPNHIYIYI